MASCYEAVRDSCTAFPQLTRQAGMLRLIRAKTLLYGISILAHGVPPSILVVYLFKDKMNITTPNDPSCSSCLSAGSHRSTSPVHETNGLAHSPSYPRLCLCV